MTERSAGDWYCGTCDSWVSDVDEHTCVESWSKTNLGSFMAAVLTK